MLKTAFVMFVVAAGFSSIALAQTAAPDQRGACKADYDKYCAGIAPGGGIVACLNKQHNRLSETCRKVLDTRKKK